MRDDVKALLYFMGGSTCGFLTGVVYKWYNFYYICEKDSILADPFIPSSLTSGDKQLIESSNEVGKMIYITGVASSAKRFSKDVFLYSGMDTAFPSFFITANPLNAAISEVMQMPKILVEMDRFRYKTASASVFNNYDFLRYEPFFLVDSQSNAIKILPSKDTVLYATRYQRSNDWAKLKSMISFINLFGNEDRYQWENIKYIVYEGDIITLGGILTYSAASDSLSVSDVNVITSGGLQNLTNYFRELKDTYKALFKIGAVFTGILVGFGLYYFLRNIKQRQDERERALFQGQQAAGESKI